VAPPYTVSLSALGFVDSLLFALALYFVVCGEMDELIIRQFLPQLADGLA